MRQTIDVSCDSSRVYTRRVSSGRISERARRKGSGPSQIFQSTLAENFKMAAMTQLAKLFSSKRRPAEEGLHSVLIMNNKVSKRDFTEELRGCPCKNRPLDFRPKTEFLQIFRVRQLVHVINKNSNNLAFNAIFQYFWRQFQRTVQNRLNRSVSSQI